MNQKLLQLGQTCLRITASEEKAASFLGGQPLVRSTVEWPKKNGKSLGFIAQLDLAEINGEKRIAWLPRVGRLLFFYDFEEWPWGISPDDKGGWTVLYENGTVEPYPLETPSDLNEEDSIFPIKYVTAETFISYPDPDRIDAEAIGLSEDDEDEYYAFIEEQYGDEPRHQIGGFPTPLQSDSMEGECQLLSEGICCESEEDYHSEAVKQLLERENDWRMLLQVDSDDDIALMWGDMGMLYFWVRESEARNCNFANVWMFLQCG